MRAPYIVVIPTDDPNVGCAYQCADEQAANALAVELVQQHGKSAVICVPISNTRTEVTIHRSLYAPDNNATPATTPATTVARAHRAGR